MSSTPNSVPNHVAIILDGNGRWAKRRGLPRYMGHHAGAKNVQEIALTAADAGVKVLSLFAFSTENWQRPKEEIDRLMALPSELDKTLWNKLVEARIGVRFIGRRDRLGSEALKSMEEQESRTYPETRMLMCICVDYGSLDEWLHVTKTIAKSVLDEKLTLDDIDMDTLESALYTKGLPPVDFLIRTSGEQRLSNFLLLQSAYAELYFTDVLWPDFKPKQFKRALKAYQKRSRKFGAVKG